MIAKVETPTYIREFHQQLRALIETFVPYLGEAANLCLSQAELAAIKQPTYLYLDKGILHRIVDAHPIRTYIIGDLVLYEPDETTLRVALDEDATIEARLFLETTMMETILASTDLMGQWIDILDADRRLLEMLCGLYVGDAPAPEVEFLQFAPGETIIAAGEESDAIYELMGGQAVASVDGTGVGYINKDEIFGELSFLTGTKRTATVKAKTPCIVQRTSTTDFETLVRTRPQLMAVIATNLAERLVDTNRRAAKLGSKLTVKMRRPASKR